MINDHDHLELFRVATHAEVAQERLQEVDLLWETAHHVACRIEGLWTKGESLGRGIADMNHPPEKDVETLWAEGYYDPDPMEVWSRGGMDVLELGAQYDPQHALQALTDFNTIAADTGMYDDPRVVCVRVLLERVVKMDGGDTSWWVQ
jgi:hypothetical protein